MQCCIGKGNDLIISVILDDEGKSNTDQKERDSINVVLTFVITGRRNIRLHMHSMKVPKFTEQNKD